ncbi:MAG: hypothetical protein IJG68_00185 [Bacilli bacterium]|nr:hypothetical protein [Bacilli bacterium]
MNHQFQINEQPIAESLELISNKINELTGELENLKNTTKSLELLWKDNLNEDIKNQLLENISKLENTTIPFIMQYTIAMKEIIDQESDVVR